MQIDTKEQYVLPFPITLRVDGKLYSVKTEKIKLDAGDYRLKEFPECCVVERKAAASELWANLMTKDSVRQGKSFNKLRSACSKPYIMLEASPASIFNEKNIPNYDHGELLDRFFSTIKKYDFGLLWFPARSSINRRRQLGEVVLRLMIQMSIEETKLNLV